MRSLTRALLLCAIAAALGTNSRAQRGGARGSSSAPLPSSTALGAGALTFGPSATARSTEAARGTTTRRGTVVYRTRGFRGRDYRQLPFAYWLTPYYFPVDYGDAYGPADYDNGIDPGAQAALSAQNALAEQVQRLSAQVAQLQYGPQAQAYSAAQESLPPAIPVTLILRDGQQLQIQNYAVMDQTFWDFSRQPARKIPISSIDIAASAKATEAKGGEFPQLATP